VVVVGLSHRKEQEKTGQYKSAYEKRSTNMRYDTQSISPRPHAEVIFHL
jgi:hypothetical protein